VAAARFPAKAPARTAAAKAQYRPGFPGRGERSRRNARVDQGGKSASSSFACFSTWQQKHISLICLIPKRGKAGGGAACPLPIGGHRSNAPRRGRGAVRGGRDGKALLSKRLKARALGESLSTEGVESERVWTGSGERECCERTCREGT